MLFVQMTGLSGSGKSTIANGVKNLIKNKGIKIEVIDGDYFRRSLFKELGYSKVDREENIRRLGVICNLLVTNNVITILAAINPYESIRNELKTKYKSVKTVWIDCDLKTLIERDTKGLYGRAMLPKTHSHYLNNLTGVNDPYEIPNRPDLVINTGKEDILESTNKLLNFILSHIAAY
jgi:adenylylsulfate kinase